MKVLITGGTNGMGKGVAKVLAGADNQTHEIIILCRSAELGKTTVKELKAGTGNQKISMVLCDLSKLSDVRNAVAELHLKHKFLDGIFVNAGIGYAAGRVETEDGMDQHFQVNYLSQFMLTLNLLDLLEKSPKGGRIIFNVSKVGEIFWDDMQMKGKWGFERGIYQAMNAKRLFYNYLHDLYRRGNSPKVSLIGFQIPKTVWTNQLNIIPFFMKTMAGIMRLLGTFITIEKCGMIMSDLFTEKQDESLKKSGKLFTRKNDQFVEMKENGNVLDKELQKKLWEISLDLCRDEKTVQIARKKGSFE